MTIIMMMMIPGGRNHVCMELLLSSLSPILKDAVGTKVCREGFFVEKNVSSQQNHPSSPQGMGRSLSGCLAAPALPESHRAG